METRSAACCSRSSAPSSRPSPGVCGSCGARRPVAELAVYLRAPGTVVRCPSCDSVLMTFVEVREVWSVDMRGLAALEM